MERMTDNDHNWGPFTVARWRKVFALEWSSGGGYWRPGNNLKIIAFGWALRIALPNILKPFGERYDTHPKIYGFSLSDMGNGYDFFQLHYGPQTHDSATTKNWSKHLPWMQWDMVRHSLYDPQGGHFWSSDEIAARKKRRKEKSFIPFDEFWKQREAVPKEHFLFEDFDGEKIIATCFIEEREWRRGTGWFRWLKYFWPAKIRRSLDLAFSAAVGTEKGSWKGGTVGHGIDMREGEFPINAFKRYCEMEHRARGNRHFKIRYIGPSKPPEPKEIRVARARGWKQCDYPHASAKDMWHHPDSAHCPEGKYISTEEMLEAIEAENKEHTDSQAANLKTA